MMMLSFEILKYELLERKKTDNTLGKNNKWLKFSTYFYVSIDNWRVDLTQTKILYNIFLYTMFYSLLL